MVFLQVCFMFRSKVLKNVFNRIACFLIKIIIRFIIIISFLI